MILIFFNNMIWSVKEIVFNFSIYRIIVNFPHKLIFKVHNLSRARGRRSSTHNKTNIQGYKGIKTAWIGNRWPFTVLPTLWPGLAEAHPPDHPPTHFFTSSVLLRSLAARCRLSTGLTRSRTAAANTSLVYLSIRFILEL